MSQKTYFNENYIDVTVKVKGYSPPVLTNEWGVVPFTYAFALVCITYAPTLFLIFVTRAISALTCTARALTAASASEAACVAF